MRQGWATKEDMMPPTPVFVGIDVSKAQLDLLVGQKAGLPPPLRRRASPTH